MSVITEIKDVGPCRKQLSIAAPAPAVEAEVQRVVQTFRKHAKAPGFRQGKMPESMVRQRYKEEIEKEVLDRLLPRYWNQASAEEQLDPLTAPQVEEVDFEPDDKLSFVAVVEVRPEIELGNIDDFDLPEPDVEPQPDEIEEALDRMRRDAGEWIEVERAAGEHDLVEATVREIGEEAEEGSEGDSVAFEVGHGQVWPELSAATSGLSAGEAATFERSPAEGEEGETRHYEVKVDAVKELELAPLDDELAGRLGGFEDVAALRSAVESSIRASKVNERRRVREDALLTELRGRHPMVLPQGVVDMEIEGMLREYADSLAARGVDLENAELDWQQMAEQIRPKAEERVQSRLVLDEVAKAKEIEVTAEELERALADMARAQKTTPAAVRQAMSESGQLDRLAMQLKRHKTLVTLMGEEETEPAGDAGDEPGLDEPADNEEE